METELEKDPTQAELAVLRLPMRDGNHSGVGDTSGVLRLPDHL